MLQGISLMFPILPLLLPWADPLCPFLFFFLYTSVPGSMNVSPSVLILLSFNSLYLQYILDFMISLQLVEGLLG